MRDSWYVRTQFIHPSLYALHSVSNTHRYTIQSIELNILKFAHSATIRILWFKQTNETTTDFSDIGKQRTVHSLHKATELQTSLFLFSCGFFLLCSSFSAKGRKLWWCAILKRKMSSLGSKPEPFRHYYIYNDICTRCFLCVWPFHRKQRKKKKDLIIMSFPFR